MKYFPIDASGSIEWIKQKCLSVRSMVEKHEWWCKERTGTLHPNTGTIDSASRALTEECDLPFFPEYFIAPCIEGVHTIAATSRAVVISSVSMVVAKLMFVVRPDVS